MKFNIKYTKLGNQFFFISNLSEWSPYCRKEYNQLWLKNNPLNNEEQKALSEMRELLKRNDVSIIFLSNINSSKIWEIVKQKLGKKTFENIKIVFKIFSPRFEELWSKEEKNLKKIEQKLLCMLNISKNIFLIFKTLFGVSKAPSMITIFLLSDPILKRSVNGGRGLGKNKIAIECSKITKNNNQNQMLQRVVIHEIIHASFEVNLKEKIKKFIESLYFKKRYEKLILKSKVYRQTHSIMGTVKEMILVSLIPEGYLAEKFFNLGVSKNLRKRKCIKKGKLRKNYYDLMLYSIFKLYQSAKEYCENKMQIDENYIENAIKCWADFEKSNLKNFKI